MIENFPNGFVIFCDDVRMEVGGKPSFMGVYTGAIVLHQAFPVALAKFCVWVTYWHKISEFPDTLKIRAWFPGDADDAPTAVLDINGAEVKQNVPEKTLTGKPPRRIVIRAQLVFTPANLKEGGAIRVTALSSTEELELGKIEVVEQDRQVVATEVAD